jgi:hypothetical protein
MTLQDERLSVLSFCDRFIDELETPRDEQGASESGSRDAKGESSLVIGWLSSGHFIEALMIWRRQLPSIENIGDAFDVADWDVSNDQ